MTAAQCIFIDSISEGAISGWVEYGILPSITIAQAILESGWGKSSLTTNAKNLFGIKANISWTGKTYSCKTKEYVNGKYISTTAKFRAYDTLSDSVKDHGAFLKGYKRYSNIIGETDYRIVADALQRDGYATSPTYASSLINLILNYKLYEYDEKAMKRFVANVVPLYMCCSGNVTKGDADKIEALFNELKLTDYTVERMN